MNTGIFAVGSFGSKILVILLTRLYSRYLDPASTDIKELLEPTALFLQPIFTFALQEYLIRFGLDKEYDKRQVFTTSGAITLAGMLLMALVVPILSLVPALHYIRGYTLLLVIYVTTSSLRMLCQQFVRSRDMVKLFSLDGILATLTLFLFNLLFIAVFKWGVAGFMLAVILSDLLSAIFLFVVADLGKFAHPRYFNTELGVKMMRYAAPLIPTIVMWTITSVSDRLFIENMHSDRAQLGEGSVTLYGYANRIPNLISMVSTIFFQAWNMSAITENESADRSEFYEKVYNAYEAILFIAAAGLLLVIKPVTGFLVVSSNFKIYADVYADTRLSRAVHVAEPVPRQYLLRDQAYQKQLLDGARGVLGQPRAQLRPHSRMGHSGRFDSHLPQLLRLLLGEDNRREILRAVQVQRGTLADKYDPALHHGVGHHRRAEAVGTHTRGTVRRGHCAQLQGSAPHGKQTAEKKLSIAGVDAYIDPIIIT